MYHQFLELADVDITKGPMEVGPTCHYMMGGIRVDAESRKPPSPVSSPPEKRRRSARRKPPRWQLPLRSLSSSAAAPDSPPQSTQNKPQRQPSIPSPLQEAERQHAGAVRAPSGGESRYTIHEDLQTTMQNLVGVFRHGAETSAARCPRSKSSKSEQPCACRRLAPLQPRAGATRPPRQHAPPSPTPSPAAPSPVARAAVRTAASTTLALDTAWGSGWTMSS